MSETNNTNTVTPNPNPETPASPAPTVTYSAKWTNEIGKFATNLGKDIASVSVLLQPLVGGYGEEEVDLILDPDSVTDQDLINIANSLNVPIGKTRGAIKKLRDSSSNKNNATVAHPQNDTTAQAHQPNLANVLLPQVPDSKSFLRALSAVSTLKVEENYIFAVCRAYVGDRVGIFNLLKVIRDQIEDQLLALEEPATPNYYKIQKFVAQKQYSDIFAGLEFPVGANLINDANRNKLLRGFRDIVLTFLDEFQADLVLYEDACVKAFSNPGAVLGIIGGALGGNPNSALMMGQPLDAQHLREKALSLNNALNRAFAGNGSLCARALAAESEHIQEVLAMPDLPVMLGTVNREQMLKKLGVNVSLDMVRTEAVLCQYILGIMKLEAVLPTSETNYLYALSQLGRTIKFDWLKSSSSESSSKKNREDNAGNNRDGSSKKGYNTY